MNVLLTILDNESNKRRETVKDNPFLNASFIRTILGALNMSLIITFVLYI